MILRDTPNIGYRNTGVAILVLIILYAGRAIFDASERNLYDGTGFPLPSILSNRPKPGQNAAVIIENRSLEDVVPLLLHFSNVLGPNWPIYLFTTQTKLPTAAVFNRMRSDGRLVVESLPRDIAFNSRGDVSNFLTKPWLYNKLAPAGHLLFFQTDSILCSQSPLRVEDFLKYDFIGAPIDKAYGTGFNGGLSLRNREKFLSITQHSSWEDEFESSTTKNRADIEFEDQWFYKKLWELPGASIPSQEIASTFSVETVWHEKPLGFHQVARWHKDKMKDVDAWCPEYTLASTALLTA